MPFTIVMLLHIGLGATFEWWFGETNWAYAAGCAYAVFVFVSFQTTALLLDRTAPARMRRKFGWSRLTFLLGDAVLHGLPLLVAIARPPTFANTETLLLSTAGGFLTWAMYSADRGTLLCFNDMYVPLRHRHWHAAEFVAAAATCAYCYCACCH